MRRAPWAIVALAQTWTEPTAPGEMQRVWNRLGDLRNQTVLLLGNGESYNELYLLTQKPQALIYSRRPWGCASTGATWTPRATAHLPFAAIDAMDLPLRDGSVDLVYDSPSRITCRMSSVSCARSPGSSDQAAGAC